ncbi:hypothetical protein [Pseudomonas sp. SO81]|uniref:hypothetical protein n=1 Tax=Pseudomonas sp. SO81 TaxID=2983246 RepID=UPI0025A33BD9|nr:hypothetical protein [Pseudomonas sp. SO81]WJN61353.1 hypothetical protein OH686_21630 [Pseudomonas sp. SO81]
MSSKTLEKYLLAAIDRGQIDHHLRAHCNLSGQVSFYIHPQQGDGETPSFVSRGNALALSLTSDSEALGGEVLYERVRQICYAIERCGASAELTHAVTLASSLLLDLQQQDGAFGDGVSGD